jgi:hypothetical protein
VGGRGQKKRNREKKEEAKKKRKKREKKIKKKKKENRSPWLCLEKNNVLPLAIKPASLLHCFGSVRHPPTIVDTSFASTNSSNSFLPVATAGNAIVSHRQCHTYAVS